MGGYLEHYGAAEDRRAKVVKILVIVAVALVVTGAVAGALLYIFHNHSEENRIKQFYALLQAKDYKGAYALFGCTDAKPCRSYGFDQFKEDFGPTSGHDNLSNVRISRSKSCGSGVLLTIDFGSNKHDNLWVERRDMIIAFPPPPDVLYGPMGCFKTKPGAD
jgi:hypothetical protein